MKKSIRFFMSLFAVVFLSYWVVQPLVSDGYFPMHDDTQPTRVQQMAKALSSGQFPVRWVPDLGYGYGYPLFNFYAPLPYYIGAFLHLSGFDVISATKLMFAIGILTASISMFFLGRTVGGNAAGVLAAVLYQYAPYHAVNIYIRGAVGEYWAYGFLPLLLLGIQSLKGTKRGIAIGSTGLACILLSHNILGMITLMLLSICIVISIFARIFARGPLAKGFTKRLIIVILLGLGVSAFFTLPAFVEKGYTRVEELTKGGSDFRKHFVYPDQLWDSPWGYAGSAPGHEDGMSFKIGKLHLFIGLLGVALFVFRRKKSRQMDSALEHWNIGALSLFVVSVFLMLEQSKYIWETIPGFAYIQYPWRFLNVTVFSLSIGSVFLLLSIKNTYRWFFALGISFLIIAVNGKYFTPRFIYPEDGKKYTDTESIRFDISRISDEYLPIGFPIPQTREEVPINLPSYRFTHTSVQTIGNAISFLSAFLLVYVSRFDTHVPLWGRKRQSK